MTADRKVFTNARFLADGVFVEALAVEGGRISAVGALDDMPSWPRVNLEDGYAVPGFNDAHVHVYKVGHLLTSMVDLRNVRSIPDLLKRLRAIDGDGWLQGRGFNEAVMDERRMPTRRDLDEACPDRPVFLTRTCGHIAVANSLALTLAGVTRDTDAPAGGAIIRDETGEPTGILHETAMGLVGARVPPPTAAEYERMILAAARRHLAMGITSASEAGVTPDILDVYRDLDARGVLPYRVNVMALRRPLGSAATLPLPEKFASDFLRIDTVKLIADGGLSGATAALLEGYRHDGSRGLLRLDADETLELSADARAAGLNVAVHAIGDAAIEAVLDAFERLCGSDHGDTSRTRLRIEHFGLPSAAQLERARALGVVAVPQPIFLHALGGNFRAYLPDGLLARAYPIRSMLDGALTVALSSDAPVVADERPLLGMQTAVTRHDADGVPIAADQAITVAEALHGYTWGGAVAQGDDDNRGRLAPGMWADFCVLSDNPFEVEPSALGSIEVAQTWVGGERRHG